MPDEFNSDMPDSGDDKSDGDDYHYHLNVPPNSPPDLHILAENIDEILQPIHKLRGTAYYNLLISLMSAFSMAAELETVACQFTQVAQSLADTPERIEHSRMAHDTCHMQAESLHRNLQRMIDFIEQVQGFNGISIDLTTLLNRIKHDWKDKGN